MSGMPILPLHVGDYMADTMHLTNEEHGAYLRLLMLSAKAGAPLDYNEKRLAQMLGVTPTKWRKLWAVIGDFFTVEEHDGRSKIVQKRLEKIRKEYSERADRNRRNGARGGRPNETRKPLKNNTTDKPSGFSVGSGVGSPEQNPDRTQKKPNLNLNQESPCSPPLDAETQTRVDDGDADAAADRKREGEGTRPPASDLIRIGDAVLAVMGWNPAQWTGSYATVQGWLNEGYGAAEIIAAAERVGKGLAGKRVGNPFGYLAKALPDAVGRMRAEAKAQDGPAAPVDDEHTRWALRLEGYRTSRYWPRGAWGPPPGEYGCQVPTALLADFEAALAAGGGR